MFNVDVKCEDTQVKGNLEEKTMKSHHPQHPFVCLQ